jgi:hypothetical protein
MPNGKADTGFSRARATQNQRLKPLAFPHFGIAEAMP